MLTNDQEDQPQGFRLVISWLRRAVLSSLSSLRIWKNTSDKEGLGIYHTVLNACEEAMCVFPRKINRFFSMSSLCWSNTLWMKLTNRATRLIDPFFLLRPRFRSLRSRGTSTVDGGSCHASVSSGRAYCTQHGSQAGPSGLMSRKPKDLLLLMKYNLRKL